MKRRVADIIMDILAEHGITDCFAVVGGGAMHLDNALALNNKIRKVFNHHEQACSMAAEAYARYSGRMAAVCVTSGPGATNAITGVVGAWQDSLPMIVLSGQVRYEISVPKSGLPLRYRGIQEFEIIPSVKNMTKYAVMLTDPLAVRREICKAIDIAMNGRRGPVWIDVPLDIQSAQVEEDDLYPEEEKLPVLSASSSELEEVYSRLCAAKRPCILAGSGIRSADVEEEFEKLVNTLGIPVIGGAWVSDNFYLDHPLYFGLSGNIGPRAGNFILQNADEILVLGNSLSFRQTGFNQSNFAPRAKITMVDVDDYEHFKPGLRIDHFIQADLHTFLQAMTDLGKAVPVSKEWIGYCDHLKARFPRFEAVEGLPEDERVCQYLFWKVFEKYETEDSILCLGNNTANSAKLQIGVRKPQQRVLTNYTCGSMGFDLPASIGAAVASGRQVYCVTGDGSIMMNLQELQTIRHYQLPVKIVVFSNDGYNAIRQTSKNFFKGLYIGCNAETGVSFPDFKQVAETFGFRYSRCAKNCDLEEALETFMHEEGQCLMEIDQRLDDPVVPKVMSRLNEDGTFSTPSLEDMAPFISQEEHDSLMLWESRNVSE